MYLVILKRVNQKRFNPAALLSRAGYVLWNHLNYVGSTFVVFVGNPPQRPSQKQE